MFPGLEVECRYKSMSVALISIVALSWFMPAPPTSLFALARASISCFSLVSA